jgi:hypothetical protein
VPFGLYNRRMFKRFFRNLVGREDGGGEEDVRGEEELVESNGKTRSIQNFSLLH